MATVVSTALALAACSSGDEASTADTTVPQAETAPPAVDVDADEVQRYPDVVDATATMSAGTWTFAVTISSPYDSPDRYADGWRILGPDGSEYGFRLLTHDHANEQPFTRSLNGVEIPEGVTTVTIEGRDQQYGFGGGTFELTLDGN